MNQYYYQVFLLSAFLYSSSFSFYFHNQFKKTFEKTCLKYNFVHQFWDNLENPSGRFLIFVFEEEDKVKGGLGDRLAGLVTATTMALRFNRTLLIQSSNQFDTLFRPYRNPETHAADFYSLENNPDNKFTYSNWTSWTSYNPSLSVKDLWYCIATKSRKVDDDCGCDSGDPSQSILKISSNRAYLCKWVHYELYREFRNVKESFDRMGISKDQDLFEVAGCLLRLVMWPTDKMWSHMHDMYEHDLKPILKASLEHTRYLQSITPTSTTATATANVVDKNENRENFYMIAAHFRCGDHSYNVGSEAINSCRYNSSLASLYDRSMYMRSGNPIQVAECVNDVVRNHFASLLAMETSLPPLFIIASDNDESAQQIQELTQPVIPHTYVSSSGCHVDYNKTYTCLLTTVESFLLLAFSDVIVLQTESHNAGVPFSAFSRFASIYGLQPSNSSMKDARNCELSKTRTDLSNQGTGNWYCF